jgi:predicted RNA-binding protein with PIN domain
LEFIRTQKPCGSSKNKVTVIFDGYPPAVFKAGYDYPQAEIIFSRDSSADDMIMAILEKAMNCRVIVVVSDDKQIKFFAKAYRAKAIGIEEFLKPTIPEARLISRKKKFKTKKADLLKPELSCSQITKINKELESLWLR